MGKYPFVRWLLKRSRWWDRLLAWCETDFVRRRSPMFPRCQPELQRLEVRWLPTLLSGITEYTIPTSSSGATGITLGPDGNVWFVENSTSKIAKVTPAGSFTEYSLNGGYSSPFDITTGPDGNLWFTEASSGTGALGKSSTGGSITDYSFGIGNPPGTYITATTGSDGALYFAMGGKIGKMTTGGSLTTYSIPGFFATATDITAGPDGNLWFLDQTNNKVGRMTTAGSFTMYTVPTNPSGAARITAGADGNLWFTEGIANKIGRITLDGTFTEWTVPTSSSGPFGITVGPDNNIWFAEQGADKIGRLTPGGTFTEWSLGASRGPKDIVKGADGNLWFTENSANKIGVLAWMPPAANVRFDDPVDGLYVPFGPVAVSPQTGDAVATVPLYFETGAHGFYDSWSAVLGLPTQQQALVYHASAVTVKPIIEVSLPTDPQGSVPTSIDLTLTWNGGSPQSPVNFGTSGHSAGDVYDLAVQVSSAVTSTGYFPWQVDITLNLSGGDTITRSITGNTAVVVSGSGATYGRGWSVGGLDSLTSVTGGVLWVYGTGGARFFESLGSGVFRSPTNDFGTLTQSLIDSTYTYTAKDQTQWKFDSGGLLTKLINPDSLTRTYSYASSRLSKMEEPDGGVTTFSYDGANKLSKIEEPGARVVTVTVDGTSGDLTGVVLPDGNALAFTYDANHKMTNEAFGPLSTTLAYDGSNGTLATVSLDAGNGTLSVSPAIEQGLATSPAKNASGATGVLTDGLGRATTYTLDTAGRPLQIVTADGATHRWSRDFAGQALPAQDALNHITTSAFNYGADKGDLLGKTFADATTEAYQYHATYHKPTQITDALGRVTTLAYTGTGNLETIRNALNEVTTLAWSNGLLQSVTDPLGKATTYSYDGARRLQSVQDPLGNRVTSYLDAAGNVTGVKDARGDLTSYAYDALGRVTSMRDATGATASYAYNALGLVTDQTDPLGRRTTNAYDSHGWLTSTTQGAGTGLTRTEARYYDAVGNVTGVADGNGNLTQYLFDGLNRLTVTVDAQSHRATSFLDAAGNVTGVKDANGNLTQYVYDSLNRATVTVDAQSNRTTSFLDAAGHVTGVKDARNNLTQYQYDALGRRTVTISPTNERTTRLFDAAGHVTQTQDTAGNATQYLFDGAGHQTVTIDAGSNRTTSLLDAAGNVTGVQDPRANLTQYLFDAQNRMTVTVDGAGSRVTSLLDSAGNVTGTLDARGGLTQYQFDGLNRVSVTIDAASNRMTSLFDAQGNVTGSLDPRGNLTQYLFDSLNRATVTVDALSNRTSSYFDAQGNVTGVKDAADHLTQYLFDALNRATVTVDAQTNRVTSFLDAAGNVTGVQDANGNLTQYQLDASNRVTVTIDAASNRTTNLMDAAGRVTGVQDGNAHLRQYLYDALGRASVTVDGAGNRVTNFYDGAGNVTGVKDGRGNLTQYLLDAANRVTVTIDPDSKRTTSLLDAAGNVTVVIDANANRATYLFDALNRATVTVDALGNRTTSFLDAAGNVTSIKDASNNLTTFAYDVLNRKSGETDPFSKRATYLYNGVGLLTETVDRLGRKIDYQYDAANRLTTQIWKDSGGTPTETLAFSYDANGNQLTAGNSVGTYTMQYDALNRVTVVQDVWGQRLTFSFDGVGNRTKVQDSKNGVATSVYDGANNLVTRLFGGTSQTPLRVDLTYNADNQVASVTRYTDLAGTTKVVYGTYSYDAVSRLSNLQYRKGSDDSNIANYTYAYDAASRVTSETRNGTPVTYGYDFADQLLSDGTATFTYDATGNRNNGSNSASTGNRLATDGTWNYSYDDEGNETKNVAVSGGLTWKYGYDNANHLTSAKQWTSDPDVYGTAVLQKEVDYHYDAWGNLAERDLDADGSGAGAAVATRYAQDGWDPALAGAGGTANFNVWAELDGSNNPLTRYLHGDQVDQQLARLDAGTAYWPLTDRMGSVREVLDSGGTVKDALTFDGFGNITGETNAAFRGNYAWTGRQLDVETELQFNRARWYDPKTARWMSEDPLGFDARDSNLYRYVRNSSVNLKDPSGMDPPGAWPEGSAGRVLNLPVPPQNPLGVGWRRTDPCPLSTALQPAAPPTPDLRTRDGRIQDLTTRLAYLEGELERETDPARMRQLVQIISGPNGLRSRLERAIEGGNPAILTPGQIGDVDPIEVFGSVGAGLTTAARLGGTWVTVPPSLRTATGSASSAIRMVAPRTPFEIARAGGRHAGLLRNYTGRSAAEVQRAIASLEARAAEHIAKAAAPAAHAADWATRSPQAQQGLINHWLSEAQNFAEQAAVLRGLLGGGG